MLPWNRGPLTLAKGSAEPEDPPNCMAGCVAGGGSTCGPTEAVV